MRRWRRALLVPYELALIGLGPVLAIEQALTKMSAPALLGQESPAIQPALPPEAQKLRAAALSAYQTGEKEQAVKLQQQLLSWMNINLPAIHPLRGGALQNMGVYLRGTGQRTEALPPTLEAVNIYRELAKSNKAFRPDLASSLNNLGVRFSELGQRIEALTPTLEAISIYRDLAKSNKAFSPDLAMVLNNLSVRLSELGRRAEAFTPILEAINIYRGLAKNNNTFRPDLAMALNNLGNNYSELGQWAEALPPTLEAVNIYRGLAKTNKAFRPDLAMALNNLSIRFGELGQRAEALPPTLEAVNIRRELAKIDEAFRPDLARSLNNLGIVLSDLGQRAEALDHTLEAVTIWRELAKTNEAFRPDLASALNNLGVRFSELGQRAQALAPTMETVNIWRELAKTNEAFRPNLASALNNLGIVLSDLGQRAEALDHTLEAVTIWRELAKTNEAFRPDLASALNNLGVRFSELGQRTEALPATLEAVSLYRDLAKVNEAFRPDLAMALNNLGVRFSELGQRAEALPPTLEAVNIRRDLAKRNDSFRPNLALSLNNLGNRFSELGRRAEALPATLEAVNIWRGLVRTNEAFRPDLAMALDNLGIRFSELGQRAEALPPTLEAVNIYRDLAKTNKAFRPDLARSLNNLGILLSDLGQRAEALAPTLEAFNSYRDLAKTNKAFRPDLAMALNNLGIRFRELGRRAEALPPAQEAVNVYRGLAKTNKAFRPDLASSLNSLGILFSELGQRAEALQSLQESVSNDVLYLRSEIPLLPEGQRQKLIAVLSDRWQIPFSLANQSHGGAELALFTRLNRKGLLLDIQRTQALLARSGPWQPLLANIRSLKGQLGSPSLPEPQRVALNGQLGGLEQELYRQLPQLKPDLVEPLQVARRLPADGVLIEFQRFFPWDASGLRFADSPRYLALILTPNGSITAVPLGEAKLIEDTIQRALRSAGGIPKSNANASPRQTMQALADVRRQLLDPLAPHIADARQLFLSPDGEINNVPLAALPIRDSDPLTSPTLGDHKTLHLLTSGRDLLPSRRASRSTSQASLVIADPDYNASLPASPATAATTTPKSRSSDSLHKLWSPLLNTKAEGDAIRKLLGGTLLQGPQATTARLQQAQGPTILHIATHGFFLPDQPHNLNTADPFQSLTTLELPLLTQADPLLRSGIVLAGANHPNANPTDDGRLTALEATALSLEGTELVTLSACSTGLGSIATGEGVYGLQRALQVAGARSTLLSLWKVDDAATRLFMEKYYSLLKQGMGRGEALRQVQQHFRNQPIHNHPHFWAAWQLSGDTGQMLNLRKGVHERDEP